MRKSIVQSLHSSINEGQDNLSIRRKLIIGLAGAAVLVGIIGLVRAASVILPLRPDTRLNTEQFSGIVYFVAGAVLVLLIFVLRRVLRRLATEKTPAITSSDSIPLQAEALSEILSGGKAPTVEESMETIAPNGSGTEAFDFLSITHGSTELLLEMIQDEHPQTIALILAHIHKQQAVGESSAAADMLRLLPPDLRTEVITRIASMTPVSPEVISQIQEALRAKFYDRERVRVGGVRNAAEILNQVEADVGKQIMESMAGIDPDLAEEISDLMFTYDDVVRIPDAGVQKLVQKVNGNDLLIALKASTEAVKAKFFRNMSERRRQSIQADLESMPPVRLKDVLAAQKRILVLAKRIMIR